MYIEIDNSTSSSTSSLSLNQLGEHRLHDTTLRTDVLDLV